MSSTLTPRESKIANAVLKLADIQVSDWNAIATEASVNTAKQARDVWGVARKKLMAGATGSSSPAAAAAGTKRKGKSIDGEEDEEGSPTVKKTKASPRGTKGKGKKAVKVEPVDEDGGAEEDVKAEKVEGETEDGEDAMN